LDPVSTVYLQIPLIVLPFDSEREDAIRLGQALEDPMLFINGIFIHHIDDRLKHFMGRLDELRLGGVPAFELIHKI
jgi:hypothetical protein